MTDDERDRVCNAWLTYQRHWWAYSTVDNLVSENTNETWPLILRVIALADTDELIEAIGAGPLENLLSKHGPVLLARVQDESARSPKLRAALGHVWLSPSENAAVDDLLKLGCQLVPISRQSDA